MRRRKTRRRTASAPAIGRGDALAQRVADLFALVQAILDHGHVVEGHGYNHEIARYLSRDEEDQVMKKAIAMIQKRTGRRLCYRLPAPKPKNQF